MKNLIRKILKEQDDINIHPDYEGVLESPNDAIFPIRRAELKIGLMVMREMNNPNRKDRNWVYYFVQGLRRKYAIEDRKILTRMALIFYFNDLVDLEDALNFKELSYIYRGPFYEAEMDYYEEDLDEDYESEDEECYECYGSGEEECGECDGSGWADEEEEEECSYCDGKGHIDCEECDGRGEIENEVIYYRLSERRISIISKEPIDMADYSYASEVLNDSNLLISEEEWTDERREREGDEWELEQDQDNIIDIFGEDIMSNSDILGSSFY
jgi:hypothetical protein